MPKSWDDKFVIAGQVCWKRSPHVNEVLGSSSETAGRSKYISFYGHHMCSVCKSIIPLMIMNNSKLVNGIVA